LFAAALAFIAVSCSAAPALEVTFRVTPGAGLRVFTKGDYHFVPFAEHKAERDADVGGYEVYKADVPDGQRFHYVAGGGNTGFLKAARVMPAGAAQPITIDAEKLDVSRREDNGYRDDGVYFNVNDAQHLVMNAGDTFRLIPIRVWQAMEGATDNYFIEPDYKVEVLSGSEAVGFKWGGSPGLEYAELTATNPGVAVLRVTYGPLSYGSESGGGTYFNAIDPVNAGIVVVTVTGGSKNSGITTNITAREYDTIYFDKGKTDHAAYTFKPGAAGAAVRAHKPAHVGGAAWGQGWADGAENPDGSFTVNLYEGRNVVEVSSPGAAFNEYHVINAKGVSVNIKNVSGPGSAPKPGDVLEISFAGIRTPLEKIAGIYNPGYLNTCYVQYNTPGSEARGEGAQYNLWGNNAMTVTVPDSGALKLTGGVINCDHMGDPLGSHRTRPGKEPVGVNMNAKRAAGVYCSLPDITIGGDSGGSRDNGGGSGGGCDAGAGGVAAMAILGFALAVKRRARGLGRRSDI
jgi:hypothetical protein